MGFFNGGTLVRYSTESFVHFCSDRTSTCRRPPYRDQFHQSLNARGSSCAEAGRIWQHLVER